MGHLAGTGSTGEVYVAELTASWRDLEAGSSVAIKRLLPEIWGDRAEEERLLAEGELGLGLSSPGLVRFFAAGRRMNGATPEIVMEWIPGETLGGLLCEGTCPEPLLRSLAQLVGDGLSCLHTAGYAHADVKPDNIRLDGNGRARLLDLGYATPFHPATLGTPTTHDPGSLAWMAPERLTGAPPSFAADVFALGLVLYVAATGQHPTSFGAELPRPSSYLPRLTPFFDELVGEMLSPSPGDRPTAREVEGRFEAGESSRWWQAQIVTIGDAGASRPRARGPLHLIIAKGRKAQLAQLAELEKRMGDDDASPLLLRGEEGSGKWELVHEFAARARRSETPPLFLSGRTTPMEEVRPYGTLLRILRTWLGATQNDPLSKAHRTRLDSVLTPRSTNTLAGVLDPMHCAPIEGSVHAAFTEWIHALSLDAPTILFVDELQDAGEETLYTLLHLSDSAPKGSRLLLILGERNDLASQPSPKLEHVAAKHMELGPLSQAAITSIVASTFDKATPRLRLSKVLMDRCRGNPAQLYELLIGLEDGGGTKTVDGRLRLDIKPQELPMPASLRALITERFQNLDRAHRHVLARMAILAGHLSPAIIRRAFGQHREEDLGSITTSLSRQRWLVPRGDHFRFARPAMREAVLAALSPASRQRLHREAAAGLAPRPGESASIGMGIRRAWHLREGGEVRALLMSVRGLIRSLVEGGQPHRVATLADWGLEALDGIESETTGALTLEHKNLRLALLEQAADCANRLGAREKERQLLDSLANLGIDPEHDPFRAARIYLLFGRHASDTGSYGIARGLLRNAHEFAKAAGRPLLSSRALSSLAEVLAESGDLTAARKRAKEASRIADGAEATKNRPAVQVGSALTLGHIAVLRGRPDRALLHVDRALATLRRDLGALEPGLRARAHLLRARIWRDLGRPTRARGSAYKARELSHQAHERALESEAAARLGGLYVDDARIEEAEEQLREALLIAKEIEDRRGMCLAQIWLGTLLAESGEPEASAALAHSANLAGEVGLHRCEAMAYALGARVEFGRGEFDKAHGLAKRAMSMLESQGAELRDRIVITGTWALLLHHEGEIDEASSLSKELRKLLRVASGRIEDTALRKLHRKHTMRLLTSVLSAEGPVYPRARATED